MVFDEVADGLRRYRTEMAEAKRIALLTRLAKTEDPRVAVALGEATREPGIAPDAALLLLHNYVHPEFSFDALSNKSHKGLPGENPLSWWKENEADLRRQAARLPR
jgi:hypothetical protein